ncbi:MAG TPA: AAA family ATPase [Dehalococcoidia bacterium]|nr:AAA family ATPase [Dehalococcoidia bacterium]
MSKKPSVVILDPNLENRAEVHRTLTLANLSVLMEGGHGVEGLTLIQETLPDAVLLGLEHPVERGLQTLEAIAASHPDMPVIVYSTVDDGPAVRRAMIAGASDYLVAPLNGRTVGEAIQAVIERSGATVAAGVAPAAGTVPASSAAAPAAAGMVITVFGAKGGIGKTTISTNLAVALATQGRASVALVDFDTRFGDVAIMLDASSETSLADAARDIDKLDRTSIRRYLTRHPSGVSLLPASMNPADWDAIDLGQIERVVHLLAQTHDYVILDTPGAFNETVALALDLATVVLLVTSMDMASIKDTSLCLNMLRSWSFPEEKVRLTVNHSNLANSVKESDISRTLDYRIFWSIPYDDMVSKSTQVGQPLVMWRPKSRAAANLTHLATLLGGGGPAKAQKPAKSLLGRLLPFLN